MNENKEYQIYEIVMLGLKLTRNTLEEYSYTDEDIDKLIRENIIIKESNDEYKLINIEGLYQYGLKLLLNFETKRGNQCFYRCRELDSRHRKASMQIFLSHLKKKEYNNAVNDFITIDGINSEENKKNNTLYLYLLNMITTIPIEYQERISNIDIEDITNLEKTNEEERNIRYAIIHNKFVYALKLLNDLTAREIIYNVENEIIKELLSQVANAEKEFKDNLYFNAVMEEYQKIILALEFKIKKRYLKSEETYILLTTRAIIKILETKEIPISSVNKANSLYSALEGNNFALALKINNSFIKKVGKNPEEETLNILLQKINSLIYELSTRETNNELVNPPLIRKRIL